MNHLRPLAGVRLRIYEILFETDSNSGRRFHILLLWLIVITILCVILDSLSKTRAVWGTWLWYMEWFFTLLFSIEYILRLYSILSPFRYMTRFFGLIELAAILPFYLSLMIPGFNVLLIACAFHLLRVFRVFPLLEYLQDVYFLVIALKTSRRKIFLFTFTLAVVALFMVTLIDQVEGVEYRFTNISKAIDCTLVTMTTVHYGDMTRQTPLGQVISLHLMLRG